MKVVIQCPHCGSEWTVAENVSTTVSLCPFCGKELNKQEKPQSVPEAIRMVIERYGRDLLKDGRRMYSFLTDLIPDKEKELRVIKVACDARGVYSAFADAQITEYKSLALRAVNILINDHFLAENWAESAVDWLLEALGAKMPQDSIPVLASKLSASQSLISQPPISNAPTSQSVQKSIKNSVLSNDRFKIIDGVLIDYTGAEDEVIVPDGVLKIAAYAFKYNEMRIIRLPDGIQEIEPYAFNVCSKLKEINIPGSVKIIRKGLLYRCDELEKIAVDEGVNEIEKNAFYDGSLWNKTLNELILPKSIRAISDLGFNCFEKVIFNGSLDDWMGISFGWERFCAKNVYFGKQLLTELCISGKYKKIPDRVFAGFRSLKKVIIEEGCEEIGVKAFGDCSIEEVNLPKSLKSIGEMAFWNCPLSDIMLPKSLKSLDKSAFFGCNILYSNPEKFQINR